MKNYQAIFEISGLIVVFAVGYVVACFYVSFNLERFPIKLSEKFRNMDVMIFPVALLGFFPIVGILIMLRINIPFLLVFLCYYSLVFVYKILSVCHLSSIQKYEKLDDDANIAKKFYQESDNRSDQKEKIRKIFGKLVDKQLENESVYRFWSKIFNRREAR